jgi:hypothetical protein
MMTIFSFFPFSFIAFTITLNFSSAKKMGKKNDDKENSQVFILSFKRFFVCDFIFRLIKIFHFVDKKVVGFFEFLLIRVEKVVKKNCDCLLDENNTNSKMFG